MSDDRAMLERLEQLKTDWGVIEEVGYCVGWLYDSWTDDAGAIEAFLPRLLALARRGLEAEETDTLVAQQEDKRKTGENPREGS